MINDFMPEHMLRLTESALAGKTLAGARIAPPARAIISDADDVWSTLTGPFFDMTLSRGAQVRVHDPGWIRAYVAPPGLSRDLEGVLARTDARVVFAGHKEYRGLEPEWVKELCGSAHPAVVDGRNVVDPDAWISAGFSYRGIGRGDKNRHALRG